MDFVGKWKIWFAISLLVIIPGLILCGIKGLNLGIDFTGGNILEVKFEKNVSTGEVRSVLKDFGLEKNPVQSAEGNRIIIRTPSISEEKSSEVINAFEKKFGKVSILRNEKVDAVVGREITTKGIIALAIASFLILLYIAYRFEFNFAVSGVLALLHDVLFVVAFAAIFRLELESSFIAVILTIIGYSINDTIVIFDRIRENLKLQKKKELNVLVNESIMQTMARSLNTSGTTCVTLIALILFGGETTKVFAILLLVGVIVGTYSSIFIASPLWVIFKTLREKGSKKEAQKA